MQHESGENLSHRMNPEFKRSHNSEIASAPANSPEQIGIFAGAGFKHSSICSDHVGREQVVERASVLADHPSESAAECETRYSGGPDVAASRCQPERLQ